MAAEVCGLTSRRDGLLACPVVFMSCRLLSLGHSLSWVVRLARFCAVPRCCGYEFGGCRAPPCVLSSSRIVCCVSLLKRRGRGRLPRPPRFYCLRFAFRLACRSALAPPCLSSGGARTSRACVPLASLIRISLRPPCRGAERYCFPCRLFFPFVPY